MVLYDFDIPRFIQVYIVQLGMGIFYFLIGLVILKRDTKRLNQLFATFYLLSASATIVNVIYASIFINPAVKILHFLTYFLFCFAIVYLLIFNLIILKSEKLFTIKKHNIIAGTYAVSLLVLILIPGGITINKSTDWKPVWSLPFLIYALIVISCSIIPTTYFSIQIYRELEDKIVKKKWAFYILATLVYFAILYLASISNFLNDPTFRLITSFAMLSLFATAYLLYYGVGKQIGE